MESAIIELSQRMGTYENRAILTKYSAIERLNMGEKYLEIVYPQIARQHILERVAKNSPETALAVLNPHPGELTQAKLELMTAIAETQLQRQMKLNLPTLEAVTEDFFKSIKTAGLLPDHTKLRYFVHYGEYSVEYHAAFLDHGRAEVNEMRDTCFKLFPSHNSRQFIVALKSDFQWSSPFSNVDILTAYAHNLQEGIKRK